MAFEVAEREPDEARRRACMTFVIVGAGPTGVELAGTLAEVTRQTLARDFRHINTASARVILIEATPRVLGAYTPDLSDAARTQLERLGVTVWTGVQVTGIDADGVSVGPERIHARTVLWAAGVAASPLAQRWGCRSTGLAGSLSSPTSAFRATIVSMSSATSPILKTTARSCRVLPRPPCSRAVSSLKTYFVLSRTSRLGPFVTLTRGCSPRSAGRRRGQGRADQGDRRMAWLLWLFVHILFLIGFRNRILVMIQWAWSYITFDRGARLITDPLTGPLIETETNLEQGHSRPH